MKNTVIVAFIGYKQSGKDTAGDILVERGRFDKIAFADPLKKFIERVYEVPYESLYGSEQDKNRPLEHLGTTNVRGSEEPVTGRLLMQYIGTEVFRTLRADTWTAHLYRRVKTRIDYNNEQSVLGWLRRRLRLNRGLVITDLRFVNEAKTALSLRKERAKVILIHLDRPGLSVNDTHVSETEVTRTIRFANVRIANEGTLDDFKAKIADLLRLINVMEDDDAEAGRAKRSSDSGNPH